MQECQARTYKMRTFETRISIDEETDQTLLKCASLFAHVEHKLFADYSRGEKLTDLKNSYLSTYNITARHFNGIRITLEGKIDSCIERQKLQREELTYKIHSLEQELKRKKDKFVLHQKKRRLAHLKHKLSQLEQDIQNKKVSLTFGSNKLFHAQFAPEENGYTSHEEWSKEWRVKRSSHLFFIGSKDETSGNQSASLFQREDGTFDLRIRLPDALGQGKYLTLSQIGFSYGKQEIIKSLERGNAISWRMIRDNKGWRLFATTEVIEEEPLTLDTLGAIAIDINVDHLAVVELDRHGNPIHKTSYPYQVHNKSKHQIRAQIGRISKEIVHHAKDCKKPIIVEKLDFIKKRSTLREHGPKVARKLSSFTYSNILTHLQSRAGKERVKVHHINPAYTSLIGKVKFAKRYGLSTHHSASLVIGRRHFGYSERPTSATGSIPDGKGYHVALSLPVRNRNKHVWSFWGRLSKKIPAALRTHFRMAKCQSTDTRKTACVTDNLPEVRGETPLCESLEELLV